MRKNNIICICSFILMFVGFGYIVYQQNYNKELPEIPPVIITAFTTIGVGFVVNETVEKGINKKFIHDFCKKYTEAYLIDQLSDEDKKDIDLHVNQIKKIIDGGNNVNLHEGIYKYLNE